MRYFKRIQVITTCKFATQKTSKNLKWTHQYHTKFESMRAHLPVKRNHHDIFLFLLRFVCLFFILLTLFCLVRVEKKNAFPLLSIYPQYVLWLTFFVQFDLLAERFWSWFIHTKCYFIVSSDNVKRLHDHIEPYVIFSSLSLLRCALL